jgi:hypothetical protein
MKFILNEGKKFCLEERFILNEASAADVAKTWTTKLNDYLTNADLVFKAYLQIVKDESKKPKSTADAEKDLNSRGEKGKEVTAAIEDIEDSLELPAEQIKGEDGQFTQIRSEVKHCHDAVEAALPTLTLKNNLKSLANTQLKALEDLSSKTAWTNDDIDELKAVLEWFSKNISPLFDTADQAKTIEADRTKLQKFIDTCNKGLEIIENIQDDLQEFNFDEGSNEDLRAYRELIQLLVTNTDLQLKPVAKINAFSNDEKQDFIDKIDNQQSRIENINSHLLKISETPLLTSTKEVVDWQTELASAANENKLKVIERFIYTVWPSEEAEKVMAIKTPLLAACKVHGFDVKGATKNPFLDFVSKVYLPYGMSADAYIAIHNSVANRNLTSKDLSAEGVLKAGNIVFCKALYKLKPEVIKMYVKKQYNLLKATASESSGFKQSSDLAFSALYKVDPPVLDGAASKFSKDLELRPMNEVEQKEAEWTGAVSSTAEEEKITINEELLKKIGSKTNAIKVIIALLIKFSSDNKIKEASYKCKEVKAELAKSISFDKLRTLITEVETTYKLTNITAAQALLLIENIIKYSLFGLTVE